MPKGKHSVEIPYTRRPRRIVFLVLVLLLIAGAALWFFATRAPETAKTSASDASPSEQVEQPIEDTPAPTEDSGLTSEEPVASEENGAQKAQEQPTDANEQPAEAPANTLAALFAQRKVTSICVIGDSITEGGPVESYIDPSEVRAVVYQGPLGTYYEAPRSVPGWCNQFRSYAEAHGVAPEHFMNAGVGNSRMRDLCENPDGWGPGTFDVIVVMLGTNDVDYEGIEAYRDYAARALPAVRARCQHLVVVSPPNNWGTAIPNHCELSEVDAVLTELCSSEDNDWEFVSMYDVFAQDPATLLRPDMVHPNEQGNLVFWEEFKSRLGLAD